MKTTSPDYQKRLPSVHPQNWTTPGLVDGAPPPHAHVGVTTSKNRIKYRMSNMSVHGGHEACQVEARSCSACDQGESASQTGSTPRFVMLSPTQNSGSASRAASSRMRSLRVLTPRAWYVANKASVMTSKKET